MQLKWYLLALRDGSILQSNDQEMIEQLELTHKIEIDNYIKIPSGMTIIVNADGTWSFEKIEAESFIDEMKDSINKV